MLPGKCGGLRFQFAPEFLREWNVLAGRETFNQQRFQLLVLLLRLGLAEQGPEILAHVAVALGSDLLLDESLKRLGNGDGNGRHTSLQQ